MVKGKEILVEEMKDVEQGVLDGEGSSVKVPLWSKVSEVCHCLVGVIIDLGS